MCEEGRSELATNFFGNVYKISELAFFSFFAARLLRIKRKLTRRRLNIYSFFASRLLHCRFVFSPLTRLLGLNIFNYVFTLNRERIFLRRSLRHTSEGKGWGGSRKISGAFYFRNTDELCAVSFPSILFMFLWVRKKKWKMRGSEKKERRSWRGRRKL